MNVEKIVVDYQVTRSRDFQSVRLGGSMEIALHEGDDKKEILEKARKFLANNLNRACEEELNAVLLGPGGDIG